MGQRGVWCSTACTAWGVWCGAQHVVCGALDAGEAIQPQPCAVGQVLPHTTQDNTLPPAAAGAAAAAVAMQVLLPCLPGAMLDMSAFVADADYRAGMCGVPPVDAAALKVAAADDAAAAAAAANIETRLCSDSCLAERASSSSDTWPVSSDSGSVACSVHPQHGTIVLRRRPGAAPHEIRAAEAAEAALQTRRGCVRNAHSTEQGVWRRGHKACGLLG